LWENRKLVQKSKVRVTLKIGEFLENAGTAERFVGNRQAPYQWSETECVDGGGKLGVVRCI